MTFGEDGEQSPLGAMALEDAILARTPALEAAGTGRRLGDDRRGGMNQKDPGAR